MQQVESYDRRSKHRRYFEDILNKISYKDWSFIVRADNENTVFPDARLYLQIAFDDKNFVTGKTEKQHGRKWWLSPHMTESEIVSTAMKAVLTAEEHEARENFRYEGAMIFGPHLSVRALVDFAKKKENIDMRTGQWVKE